MKGGMIKLYYKQKWFIVSSVNSDMIEKWNLE